MKLSEYASALPKLEKTRYTEKLVSIKCTVDPYIDENFSYGSLPAMSYTNMERKSGKVISGHYMYGGTI